ncbi:type 1 glutamine amidotransferase [Eubacteriaceae bacterium ES2]|nr:type 1 glutamine amidotransferase [Eubacteriaceae bacterium ES2]
MKFHYLQHVAFENPGIILEWIKENHHTVSHTRLDIGQALPEIQDFDALIVMGGPMNIYEEEKYPWLKSEKAFIKKAIDDKKFVLGICLGAQLIADVIGGQVKRNQQVEIGWFPIEAWGKGHDIFPELSQKPEVFHWHGDFFTDLPEDAIIFAKSQACPHQGYVYREKVFGFQFHLENTAQIIGDLVANCKDEMVPGTFVQSPDQVLDQVAKIESNNLIMKAFLDRYFKNGE